MAAKKVSRSSKREEIRLWGAPDPANFKQSVMGKSLTQTAKIHFTDSRKIDELLAVEKLAIDIFMDASAARAFSVNPKEYTTRSGFPNVELDLNSQEVRLAMTLGDPAVRSAAAQGDIVGFVRAIIVQGPPVTVGPTMGFLVTEILVHASVAASAVAVAVTKAIAVTKTVAVVETKVSDDGGTILANQVNMLSVVLESVGYPQLIPKLRSKKVTKILASYIALQMKGA